MTSYQNVVTAELSFDGTYGAEKMDSTLFSIIHNIANKNGLHFDSSKSVLGKSVGFFGRPYHYFDFTISDSSAYNTKLLRFTHDARLSSGQHNYEESEYMLMDSLKVIFQENIKEIQLKHNNY